MLISSPSPHPLLCPLFSSNNHHRLTPSLSSPHAKPSPRRHSLISKFSSGPTESVPEPETELITGVEIEIEIEIEKLGAKTNRRRISSRIGVDAELETVWRVLTDYEGLAAFIPGLVVSQLLDKRDNFARLYQVGEQNLALGLKFNAKVVLECYERDLEVSPSGRRRVIEFKMAEGDFQTFEGRWSIEQIDDEMYQGREIFSGQEFRTILSYVVELEPKRWLPVHLLEGRLCREVKTNIQCVREEAQRVQRAGNEVPFDLEKVLGTVSDIYRCMVQGETESIVTP